MWTHTDQWILPYLWVCSQGLPNSIKSLISCELHSSCCKSYIWWPCNTGEPGRTRTSFNGFNNNGRQMWVDIVPQEYHVIIFAIKIILFGVGTDVFNKVLGCQDCRVWSCTTLISCWRRWTQPTSWGAQQGFPSLMARRTVSFRPYV